MKPLSKESIAWYRNHADQGRDLWLDAWIYCKNTQPQGNGVSEKKEE